MKTTVKLATGLGLIASLAFGAQAIADEKKGLTVADGVFSEAQVASGEAVYNSQCKTCHNMRFYEDTLRGWNNQPLLYLWETVMGTMPADNPGSLMFDEYTNVMAYIFSEMGYPTGDMEMDPDENMEDILIINQ